METRLLGFLIVKLPDFLEIKTINFDDQKTGTAINSI